MRSLLDTFPQTNIESRWPPLKGTVVFIGRFLGFNVRYKEGISLN